MAANLGSASKTTKLFSKIKTYLTGMHLTSVHLMGVCLMGVYLTGVHLTGVHLMGVQIYACEVHACTCKMHVYEVYAAVVLPGSGWVRLTASALAIRIGRGIRGSQWQNC